MGVISSNAVLSGTVSEIGGGKFANGAITGAFSVMFNDMMHSIRRKTHDLIVYGNNKMKNRIVAMKLMIRRSKQTGNEVAAAILEDGNVVIFHDGECEPDKSVSYYSTGVRDGEYVELYRNKGKSYVIRTYLHTHPHSGCKDNPLCISTEDYEAALRFNNEINILMLNGDFYRQSTLPGQSTYIPNYRGNIYDKSFTF